MNRRTDRQTETQTYKHIIVNECIDIIKNKPNMKQMTTELKIQFTITILQRSYFCTVGIFIDKKIKKIHSGNPDCLHHHLEYTVEVPVHWAGNVRSTNEFVRYIKDFWNCSSTNNRICSWFDETIMRVHVLIIIVIIDIMISIVDTTIKMIDQRSNSLKQ